MESESGQNYSDVNEFSTFTIGDTVCGLEITQIQEINKHLQITKVPQTKDYVEGIINLRGRIVTLINVGKKLGIRHSNEAQQSKIIITKIDDEYIGLMVDAIGDVISASTSEIEPIPSNMDGLKKEYFTSVIKLDEQLIGVIDVANITA